MSYLFNIEDLKRLNHVLCLVTCKENLQMILTGSKKILGIRNI
jgi:hypothetical protein